MKKLTSIFLLSLALLLAAPWGGAFAARTAVEVRGKHDPSVANKPITRSLTGPVICFADREAGYAELHFMMDIGELRIILTGSDGSTVDEITVDTAIEDFVILNIPDPRESYTMTIEGGLYSGESIIH